MTQLVNDLLHFSRFSREPLHRLCVPLRELVLQTVARLKESLGEHQPSVVVGDLPDCFGDRSLLEQVLINLLSNAFKFSAGRDPPHIEVGALRQGADTVYYVRDNGVGFDMRYADKLFGVFQRLHSQEAFEARASACPSCIGSLPVTVAGCGRIAAPTRAQRSISPCPRKSGPSRREPTVHRSTRPNAWACATPPGRW